MRHIYKALSLATAAGLIIGGTTLQAAPRVSAVADCKAVAETPLTPKAGEQELRVTVSEPLTGDVTATMPDSAMVKVNSVTANGATVTLRVDASAAKRGQYPLTLTSSTLSCRGDVSVGAPTETALAVR